MELWKTDNDTSTANSSPEGKDIARPKVPTSIEETGIGQESLLKLVAKTLHVHGTLTPGEISRYIKLSAGVVVLLLKELQRARLIEAKGLAGADMRSELRYALGGDGIAYVTAAFAQSEYVGPAPVSLDAWVRQIKAQTIARERISRVALRDSLSHLVLPSDLVDVLGPAVNSARSILLYGKPGNGKTSIAEAMGSAFLENIYVPHCIEVGGQIIKVFDPTVHTIAERTGTHTEKSEALDTRWQLCKRPFVITGGELTLDMLDLAYNPISRFYEAPLHLKVVGGVFIVDDFGRQRTDPQSVLNRWIVPLERKYDFLTLHTGMKFSVPFDQLVVFSTNIEPTQLADAGGLRRLYYKIHIPTPRKEDFVKIFQDTAAEAGLPVVQAMLNDFIEENYGEGKAIPAGHHPRYIVDFIRSVCTFRGEPLKMTPELLSGGYANLDTH